jgi:hypothetical protein
MSRIRSHRFCDVTHLRGLQCQPPAVERASERQADAALAEPAQLDNDAFERCKRQRGFEAGFARAGMDDQRRFTSCVRRRRERHFEAACDLGTGRVDVDQLDARIEVVSCKPAAKAA